LTFYTPQIDPDGDSFKAAFILDAITTAFFCLEVVLKVISGGFMLNGPNSYLQNPVNVIDFLATVVAILTLAGDFELASVRKLFLLFGFW
jgi:hypothetical protein